MRIFPLTYHLKSGGVSLQPRTKVNMFLNLNFSSKTALFWAITDVQEQPISAIFEGSSSWILDNWKMGLTGCPETSGRNYHYSLYNSPEECGSHLLRGRSLRSSLLPLSTASY